MEERPDIGGAELEPGIGGGEEARDVLVRDKTALGLAGGTGGVDDVGDVGRADGGWLIIARFSCQRAGLVIEKNDGAAKVTEM